MPVFTSRISQLARVSRPRRSWSPPRARPHRARRARRGRSRSDPPGSCSPSSRPRRCCSWARTSSAIASALTSGTSPLSTTTGRVRRSPDSAGRPRRARSSSAIAATTAPPVPFALGCTASSHTLRQHALRAPASGESTTTTRPAPAASAARTGHSTIGMPHSSCSTFGVRERMRVPCPAARIRTVGAGVTPGMLATRYWGAGTRTPIPRTKTWCPRQLDDPPMELHRRTPGFTPPQPNRSPAPNHPSAHPPSEAPRRRPTTPHRVRRPDRPGTRPPSAPASDAGPPAAEMPSTRIAFKPRLSFSRPSLELTSRPESSRTRSRR